MKTPTEQYAEVQALAKVDVLLRLRVASYVAESNDCPETAEGLREAQAIVSSLITLSRRILKTGFTIEDHRDLAALLERIK